MSRIGCRTLLYWNRFKWKSIDYMVFTNYTNQIYLDLYTDIVRLSCNYKNKYIRIDLGSVIKISINFRLVFLHPKGHYTYGEELHDVFNQVQLTNYNDLYKYIKIAMDYIDKI